MRRVVILVALIALDAWLIGDRYRDKAIKDFLVELHQAVGNPKHSK